MSKKLTALTRRILLGARILPVPEGYALDPHTADFLLLVQQRKRLSLSATIGRLRPKTLLLWPVIIPLILVKAVNLWIANQIVRSMLNEHELLARASGEKPQ